ncbi:MAG TPA: hypothetical protein VKR06_27205 [Ktedonosporobacter sp.]|nr:hypothetical protein [Ktedonosporobacter sp.]
MQMPATPKSGGIAFQTGAIVGVILGVVIGGGLWIPGIGGFVAILGILLAIIGNLGAGLLAARRTGRVVTGTMAGLWAAPIGTLVMFVILAFALATFAHTDFVNGAASNGQDPQTAEQYAWLGLAILGVILFAVSFGVGAGLGALGGLIGKSMSPTAQQPYQPVPAYPQVPYQAPQPPYPPSSYPPPSYPPTPSSYEQSPYASDPYSNPPPQQPPYGQ